MFGLISLNRDRFDNPIAAKELKFARFQDCAIAGLNSRSSCLKYLYTRQVFHF